MKKVVLLILVLIQTFNAYSQLERDKQLHFLGGTLFGLVGAGAASQISDGNRAWTFVGALGGSLLIGLAKEAIDENQYNGWDNGDLLTTILGGVTAGITVDIFKQAKKRKRARIFKEAMDAQKEASYNYKNDVDNSFPFSRLSPRVLESLIENNSKS